MFSRFFSFLASKWGVLLLSFVIGAFITFTLFYKVFFSPFDSNSTTEFSLEVVQGSTLKNIAITLQEKGIIKNWWGLYFIGRLKDLNSDKDASNSSKNIHRGEYKFSPSQSPIEILTILTSGKTVSYDILIPEGKNINDVVQIIAKSNLVSLEEIKIALNDRQLMDELGIPLEAGSFEGYLFPDTYKFSKPITPKEIIKEIIQSGRKKIASEIEGWADRAILLKLTPHQILTLASIIEKETGKDEERPVISSVFYNRLRLKMPLQSDPTVIYGLPNFDGNLKKEDLNFSTPYNTYMNTGLPPTPIANPGIPSIRAALFPKDTNFLYFVSKGDGSHEFSEDYKSQQNAVKKFQQKK